MKGSCVDYQPIVKVIFIWKIGECVVDQRPVFMKLPPLVPQKCLGGGREECLKAGVPHQGH